MTYIVNDKCIKCKLMDCVEVCPVDCFYEGKNMLVIKPDECIDCGVCEPECPIDAIVPDTESENEQWLELNKKYSEVWPNITEKKDPPKDSEKFKNEKNNIPSGVLIFQPHPRKFFRPNDENFIISDIKTRSYLLENCGLDFLGILDFDKKMSNLTPYEFVDNVINNAIDVSHLIVGYNFKFGKDRSGDVQALTDICKKLKIK